MHSLRYEISPKFIERKVDSAVRGERLAQQRLYEAETEVEARSWEKRNSEFDFQEINNEFESQRFQRDQVSQWLDQAQIEELRTIFCDTTDRARQARIDELSLHQERGLLGLCVD